eukprot:gene7849-12062_t
MKPVTGACYCAKVKFVYDSAVPVTKAVFCHCDSCRRAHGAPLYQVIYVPRDSGAFKITAGEEHIKRYRKPGAPLVRAFCTVCGSRVFNDHDRVEIGVFPALLHGK